MIMSPTVPTSRKGMIVAHSRPRYRPFGDNRTEGDIATRHLTAGFHVLDVNGRGFIEEVEGLAIGKALGFLPPSQYWDELCCGKKRVSLDDYLIAMSGMTATATLMLKIELEARHMKMAMSSSRNSSTFHLTEPEDLAIQELSWRLPQLKNDTPFPTSPPPPPPPPPAVAMHPTVSPPPQRLPLSAKPTASSPCLTSDSL